MMMQLLYIERSASQVTSLKGDPGEAMLAWQWASSFTALLCESASRDSNASHVLLSGWRGSLADMREAIGPPGGGSWGSPSTYADAVKPASRQLQTLAPLIAGIGQAQLLQQRTNSELRSTSRCVAIPVHRTAVSARCLNMKVAERQLSNPASNGSTIQHRGGTGPA